MASADDDKTSSTEAPQSPAPDPGPYRRALDRMVEIAEAAGMYERTALPKRTR